MRSLNRIKAHALYKIKILEELNKQLSHPVHEAQIQAYKDILDLVMELAELELADLKKAESELVLLIHV